MTRGYVVWPSGILHLGEVPADETYPHASHMTDLQLNANFEITSEMIDQLRRKPWVYLVEPARAQRAVRMIIRWREVPHDCTTIASLLTHILSTLLSR